jgi:hypothetical protein
MMMPKYTGASNYEYFVLIESNEKCQRASERDFKYISNSHMQAPPDDCANIWHRLATMTRARKKEIRTLNANQAACACELKK